MSRLIVLIILPFLAQTSFSQARYKVKIIKSDSHSIQDNKKFSDTIYGTILIPQKNSHNDADLKLDGENFSIPNRIWKANDEEKMKSLDASHFKSEVFLYVLSHGLISENLFYSKQSLAYPANFTNVITLKSAEKTIAFGFQDNHQLDHSCYSIEVARESGTILQIMIDFNRVENTSAFERRIEEKWELTRLD